MRKKLVVWSGGLDSTLLLHQQSLKSSKENPVMAVSFVVDYLNKNKVKRENKSRNNYLKYADKIGFHIQHNMVSVTSEMDIHPFGWAQQKVWFAHLLPYIPDYCDVYFGYIQGDCFCSAINYFQRMFDEFKYVSGIQNSTINFPFIFKEKWEILKDFRAAGVPEDCYWTCEEPDILDLHAMKGRGCGKCHPCQTLLAAEYLLKLSKRK